MFLLQVALYRKNKSFKHFVSHVVLLYSFTRNNQEQEKKKIKPRDMVRIYQSIFTFH